MSKHICIDSKRSWRLSWHLSVWKCTRLCVCLLYQLACRICAEIIHIYLQSNHASYAQTHTHRTIHSSSTIIIRGVINHLSDVQCTRKCGNHYWLGLPFVDSASLRWTLYVVDAAESIATSPNENCRQTVFFFAPFPMWQPNSIFSLVCGCASVQCLSSVCRHREMDGRKEMREREIFRGKKTIKYNLKMNSINVDSFPAFDFQLLSVFFLFFIFIFRFFACLFFIWISCWDHEKWCVSVCARFQDSGCSNPLVDPRTFFHRKTNVQFFSLSVFLACIRF